MVIALMKLCLCFYLYHSVQVLAKSKKSGSHVNSRNTMKASSINIYENGSYLIHTPGCTIPNIWAEHQIEEAIECNSQCGPRAVFIERVNNDNIIKFIVDKKRITEIFGETPYECCSQFAYIFGPDLQYTDCIPFVHGTHMVLQQEIVIVTCYTKVNSSDPSKHYEDAYILVQKLERESRKRDENSWNVLLMGMDTMSRGRAMQSMPKLVTYFKKNGWLDYRAFQKAEINSYPNLMITYTGIYKSGLLSRVCNGDRRVCNNLFIWSKFKSSGFVTAYGEDDLLHTFENVLPSQPTDHYPRTLFRLGTQYKGNVLCLKTRPSAHHILDYAYQFARAYKDEKFFGAFWTSRYSHDPVNIPTLLQNRYVHFFKKLKDLGTLNNTIIFFYGDHGVRYGHLKTSVASFYDERLPMLYMWFPHSFRKRFEDKYHNLELNQHRLTTHSDLHSTLWDILKLSDDNVTIIPPAYCPRCGSLFKEKSVHRRCKDMDVKVRWCSCYDLHAVRPLDIEAKTVPEFFIHQTNIRYQSDYDINTILRHHWFTDDNDTDDITYYLIAIQVIQNDKQYEGFIKKFKSDFDVVYPIDNISPRDTFDMSDC